MAAGDEEVRPLLVLWALLLAGLAQGREADGRLDLILQPHNGFPALVSPEGTFDCVARTEAELFLVRPNARLPLATEWKALPGGRYLGNVVVPSEVLPGSYALEAVAGELRDRTRRSVYVRPAFPEYYAVAHCSAPSIEDNDASAALLEQIVDAVNESSAAMLIVTGPLTATGSDTEFRRVLDALDRCVRPTFVTPGIADGSAYEMYFGPRDYVFQFGEDGFMGLDCAMPMAAASLDNEAMFLQLHRRAIQAARWRVGLCEDYTSAWPARRQLVLCIDEPLDLLLCGGVAAQELSEPANAGAALTPWGKPALVRVPPASEGYYRIYELTARGPLPQPLSRVETP